MDRFAFGLVVVALEALRRIGVLVERDRMDCSEGTRNSEQKEQRAQGKDALKAASAARRNRRRTNKGSDHVHRPSWEVHSIRRLHLQAPNGALCP